MNDQMNNMMQQAKMMQELMQKQLQEVQKMRITAESGAGMVQLVVNGNGEALEIKISEEAQQQEIGVLQGLIVAAINDAQRKRKQAKEEKMRGMLSEMGLPANLDMSMFNDLGD